jgi:hypothetical protein
MTGNFVEAPSHLTINRANDLGRRALHRVQFMLVKIDVTTAHEENDRCSVSFLCGSAVW